MPRKPDVVVVGGGIVGGAIAYRLAKDGLAVTLLERGDAGRESSWAAGGILTPIHLGEYPTPLAGLCAASLRLYAPLVRALQPLSSVDPEYRTTGLLMLAFDDSDRQAIGELETWKRAQGQPVEPLTREQALDRQPGLSPEIIGALFLPDIAQVRNHRMTAALHEAAAKEGVEIRTNTPVTGFLRVPGRVNGVKTTHGDVYAGTTVLAAGAWSGDLVRPLGLELPVRPVKGQMLLVEGEPDFLRHMVLADDEYLVPRADGKILIGSTVEDVGFDKAVTLEATGHLASVGARMMPSIGKLPLVKSWAGLRPATPDRLPYIGPSTVEGLIVATGHFRNGILLAPVTAELVSEILAGRPPSVPLEPFDPARAPVPAP